MGVLDFSRPRDFKGVNLQDISCQWLDRFFLLPKGELFSFQPRPHGTLELYYANPNPKVHSRPHVNNWDLLRGLCRLVDDELSDGINQNRSWNLPVMLLLLENHSRTFELFRYYLLENRSALPDIHFSQEKLLKGSLADMGRYCIICHKLFGCIKEKVRHVCQDCESVDLCSMPDHFVMSQITGGICDHCWETRETLKDVIRK
jgi:hypothetical protein